jgi:hypothetical protein
MMHMNKNQDELTDQITLCDALDRMLNKGVVINGDLTVSVAGVELLYVGLRGLICAIDAMDTRPASLCSFPRMSENSLMSSTKASSNSFNSAGSDHAN